MDTIGLKELKEMLNNHCKNIYFSDFEYGLTSPALGKKFTRKSDIHLQKYIRNGRDCDEFSLALYNYWNKPLENFAFGIAWSDSHAFNIGIFKSAGQRKIYIIEPQNNEWWKIGDIDYMAKYSPIRMILL